MSSFVVEAIVVDGIVSGDGVVVDGIVVVVD